MGCLKRGLDELLIELKKSNWETLVKYNNERNKLDLTWYYNKFINKSIIGYL
jgi:hypothetical protein